MSPTYGEPQTIIAVVFVAVTVILAGVFTVVAMRSRTDVPLERVRDVAYGLRRWWLGLLVVLLGGVLAASFFLFPYSSDAQSALRVSVSSGQFFWSMSPSSVPAGSRVRFEVTSVDVNHGFGLYDPEGHLLGNVQAMPGYTNDMELQLDDPGTYLISCLEFCGSGHHEMTAEFEVGG